MRQGTLIAAAALLALTACTPPARIVAKQQRVALVLEMDPKAAPALAAEQVARIADLYREALRSELAPAQVIDGPAPDEETPQVTVRIGALAPPVLEKGLFKAWMKDTTMEVVVAPLLAAQGVETGHTDSDALDRAIHRSVDKHRLAQLRYRPFILVGSLSVFDAVHRYDEDLDGWKLLALMRPVAPAGADADEAWAIRREEARALAMDVKARLDSRADWRVSLRHPPEPPTWLKRAGN